MREIMQATNTIKLRYEDGVFVLLTPLPDLEDGETLEFRVPDPNIVYLCETDRQAALDRGLVVRADEDSDSSSGIDA